MKFDISTVFIMIYLGLILICLFILTILVQSFICFVFIDYFLDDGTIHKTFSRSSIETHYCIDSKTDRLYIDFDDYKPSLDYNYTISYRGKVLTFNNEGFTPDGAVIPLKLIFSNFIVVHKPEVYLIDGESYTVYPTTSNHGCNFYYSSQADTFFINSDNVWHFNCYEVDVLGQDAKDYIYHFTYKDKPYFFNSLGEMVTLSKRADKDTGVMHFVETGKVLENGIVQKVPFNVKVASFVRV